MSDYFYSLRFMLLHAIRDASSSSAAFEIAEASVMLDDEENQ